MNKSVTSKDKIINICKEIVIEEGLNGINIRKVASKCNTAVGSIYYYFPSKSDLIIATIENIWFEIFHTSKDESTEINFIDYINSLFQSVQEGCNKYPNFFTLHSISFASKDKKQGKITMEKYFGHMKKSLVYILNKDPNVNKDVFNSNMSKEEFINMIFSIILSMLIQKNFNTVSLCELIKKIIYQGD